MIRVGTAGWSLPTEWQDRFPEGEPLETFLQTVTALDDRPDAEATYTDDAGEAEPAPGLGVWADRIRAAARDVDEVWCVFDDTAAGEGTGDALALLERLEDA